MPRLSSHLSLNLVVGIAVLSATAVRADSLSSPLSDLVSAAEANPKIPGGSIRVVEDREIVFDDFFGTLTAKSDTPWDEQTIVAIASISKSITATLTAVLVGEEKLKFSDPIALYLPEYGEIKLAASGESVRSPTIAECLSHTAGFPGGTMAQLPRNSPVHRGDQAEVAHHLAAQGLATEPGTHYAYSFRGFAAVARVIEVVMERPFAEVLTAKLLTPLGMTETTFTPTPAMSRRIPAYADRTLGRSDEQVAAQIKRFRTRRGSFVNSAGALFSTPDDLQRFLQFHADQGRVDDRQIVSADVLAQLYKPQPASTQYGLGFKIRSDSLIGHGGATGTTAQVDLASGRILIVLTQAGAPSARPLTAGAIRTVFP
ncbi:MAG: serine hydrolase domain-containing protein [Synoicihabitans sp.]